jgi:RNA polymerase sigma factor for flagellar operon FliA
VISVRVVRKVPLGRDKIFAGPTETVRGHRGPQPWLTGSARQPVKFACRDDLVLGHLLLARTIAVDMQKKLPVHVELDDLVQTGVIGLVDAANKFDPARQDVFSHYARHRIKGAILDSLRRLDWASRDMRRKHKLLEAAKYDLTSILQRAPTEVEVAEKLGMDLERLRVMMLDLKNRGPISTDTRPNEGDYLPALDLPSKLETQPDFMCIQKELRSTLGEAIKTLPARYQKVVLLYYTKELTMKAIGALLGINESRVSQVHKLALGKMAIVLRQSGIDCIHAFQD